MPGYLAGFSGENTPEGAKSWSYKQTSIAAATFIYAAAAKGLATCPMEGFDQEAIKKALGLSDRYSVAIVVSVGYPKDGAKPRASGRRPPTEVFFEGQLGGSTAALFETK
jgi:nitroreductase